MNRLSSLLGGLAIIAIAVVFVVNFQPGGGQNQLKAGPECAAHVLGNCVKVSHFWASYNLLRAGVDQGSADRLQLKQKTLDGLIERELLLAEAKRLGISVSDEEVTKELYAGRIRFSVPSSMPAQQAGPGMRILRNEFLDKKTKKFSPEQYKKAIAQLTRLSEVEFRDFQKEEIIASRMRDLIMSRVQISETEARDEFIAEKSTAKVRYVKLHPGFYVDRAVDRSEKAVSAWAASHEDNISKAFDARKKELGQECREARHILIEVKKGAPEDVKAKAKAKLEAARKRILAGESFEMFAEALSEDPGTRLDGGRIGCLPRGEMKGPQQPFETALYNIKDEGGVSEVVETATGVHLIRFDKLVKGADAEKSLKDRITREQYVASEGKRLAEAAAKELQDAMKAGTSLEDALKNHLAKYPGRKALPAAPLPVPMLDPNEKKDEPKKDEPAKTDAPKTDGPKPDDKGKPKKDEPKKDEPKKDEPKKDEPKKDEPKKDEPKKDEPKKDEPKKDEDPLATPSADILVPTVETSLSFIATEEAIDDALDGQEAAAYAFQLSKPNDVAEKLIPLKSGGFAVMQLIEKKVPTDDEWLKVRGEYIDKRRAKKQQESFAVYMKRLRSQHTGEIKVDDEANVVGSAKAANSNQPPPPEEEE
ncbi:MAG: peptidylprolyl isomerase [Polyangiaceae bacterium]